MSMPSRACTSLLRNRISIRRERSHNGVNALSGLYLIATASDPLRDGACTYCVNALSGLYLIATDIMRGVPTVRNFCVNALSGLYLIATRQVESSFASMECSVNALSGLYLIATVPLQKPRFYAVSRACFCRYLSEYSDSSLFSCMLTIWTYLMR